MIGLTANLVGLPALVNGWVEERESVCQNLPSAGTKRHKVRKSGRKIKVNQGKSRFFFYFFGKTPGIPRERNEKCGIG